MPVSLRPRLDLPCLKHNLTTLVAPTHPHGGLKMVFLMMFFYYIITSIYMRSARIAVCLRHDRHRCTSPCVVDSSIYNPIHLHKGSDLKSKVLTSWPRMLKTCTCQHKSPYLPYCSIKSLLIRSVAIFSYGVTSQLTGLHG